MGIAFLNSFDSNYISIENEGFDLSASELKSLRIYLEALEEEVPLYSFIALKFSFEANVFKANLQINSFKRQFKATAQAKNLNTCYKLVDKKIRKQITTWKASRFLAMEKNEDSLSNNIALLQNKEDENVKEPGSNFKR